MKLAMMKNKLSDSSFLEHLEELRWRCFYVLVFFIVILLGVLPFSGQILTIFIKPIGTLYFTSLSEPFLAYLSVSFWTALVVSFPFLLYQGWRFISIGLYISEKKFVLVWAPIILLLFSLGVCFAYFILLPIAIRFLLSFSSNVFSPIVTIKNYVAFVGAFILYTGVSFELPILMMLSVQLNMIKIEFYQEKRRHIIVGILIICAFFTPPDVVTQVLLAGPLWVLYEIGILFSKRIQSRSM